MYKQGQNQLSCTERNGAAGGCRSIAREEDHTRCGGSASLGGLKGGDCPSLRGWRGLGGIPTQAVDEGWMTPSSLRQCPKGAVRSMKRTRLRHPEERRVSCGREPVFLFLLRTSRTPQAVSRPPQTLGGQLELFPETDGL